MKTSDLNLANDAGVQALYHRIQAASRSVCKDLAGPSARTRVAHAACVRTALDGAVLAAKSEALTSLHVAMTGEATSLVAAK